MAEKLNENQEKIAKKIRENSEKATKKVAESSEKLNEKIAKNAGKFAKLVTEGPKNYREKYAGMTDEEISRKIEDEVNAKIAAAEKMREEKFANRENFRAEKMRARRNYHMTRKNSLFGRVFAGILFLLGAVAIALMSFGQFVMPHEHELWLGVAAVLLGIISVASLFALAWFPVFFAGLGSFLVLNLGYHWFNFSSSEIWGMFAAAFLLAISFSILFHRNWRKRAEKWNRKHYGTSRTGFDFVDETFANSDENEKVDRGEIVIISARMSEETRYVESQNLKKVVIDAKLGGAKVYFQNAKISGKKLEIVVDAKLGGVELNVPRNWKLRSEIRALAGGVSENGHAEIDENSPEVVLKGNANLGGVSVNYL